jgi:hypothetical protein
MKDIKDKEKEDNGAEQSRWHVHQIPVAAEVNFLIDDNNVEAKGGRKQDTKQSRLYTWLERNSICLGLQ